MFSFIHYIKCRDHFNRMLLGCTHARGSHIQNWWEGVAYRKDPRLYMHPMCSRPNWIITATPIAIHGDAVPVIGVGRSGAKSLDCYSWWGILGYGPALFLKNYILKLAIEVDEP